MDEKTLEDFPHIINKLQLFWGYIEIYDFFDSLYVNSRTVKREGFPINVIMDLHFLEEIHAEIISPPFKKDVWTISPT